MISNQSQKLSRDYYITFQLLPNQLSYINIAKVFFSLLIFNMKFILLLIAALVPSIPLFAHDGYENPRVKVANGILEGVDESGVFAFKGIPFAAPPVGDLRWREPQPAKNWEGVRKADKFGPRPMQRPIFGDMQFRSDGMSEDCLYLNVWTPAKTFKESLPVLVYFYGGGLMAGDGSESRYDGESMARKGIVALTVNYRLNAFGFFAHPGLTKESPQHASGNYGFLDQVAALKWVRQNIAAFGGDPNKVTIAGESAGSISVSAIMASPISKNLISRAIGESGSVLGALSAIPLKEGEEKGERFATLTGAKSLAELRKIPAQQLLDAAANREFELFSPTIDGYFFPKSPFAIYEAGEQAQIPLLVGWNSEEMNYRAILGQDKPNRENYMKAVQRLYPEKADQVLKLYNVGSDEEVEQVATDLAGDRFIGFSTWKWSDQHSSTAKGAVYRYLYSHPRPVLKATKDAMPSKGAVHSAEIEYALGNLSKNVVYDWQSEDYKVSEILQSYFANFIKTGNPNGLGLPEWQPLKKGASSIFMNINVKTGSEIDKFRNRYLLLDQLMIKK